MSNIIPFQRRTAPTVLRHDVYYNSTTGYGTSRDHGEQFEWAAEACLSTQMLNSMYAHHPIVWKLVDSYPDDGLREWIQFDVQPKLESKIKREIKRLKFRSALNEGLKMAELHGGAALYIQFKNQRPDTPIDWDSPGEILGVHVLEKDYVWPESLNRSLRCEFYNLTLSQSDSYKGPETSVRVHCDRLIILQGCSVSRDWKLQNGGWAQSRVDRSKKPLLAYTITHGLVPNIMKDFVRDVIKLFGLADLDVNENEQDRETLKARLDAMFQAESTMNKTVLDSQDEYVRTTTSVTGLNDLIRNPEKYLVAASGMPHTKILGENPGGGLGSDKGKSQDNDWNKSVAAYQEDKIRPAIEYFLLVLMLSLGIEEDIDFSFNPLDVPSLKERADTFKTVAEAIAKLIEFQVISPMEARTMFAGEEIRLMPTLDTKSAAMLAAVQGEQYGEESEE